MIHNIEIAGADYRRRFLRYCTASLHYLLTALDATGSVNDDDDSSICIAP